jgi:hypothetical protein
MFSFIMIFSQHNFYFAAHLSFFFLQEIVAALECSCNIVPIIDNFDWPSLERLPEDMRGIVRFNCVRQVLVITVYMYKSRPCLNLKATPLNLIISYFTLKTATCFYVRRV